MKRLHFKAALLSLAVVVALTGLLLGVRLEQQGTSLSLSGATPDVLWKMAGAGLFIFLFNLLRDWIDASEYLKAALADAVVFDGRNMYEPADVEAAGLAYYGIGRGRSLEAS